jgi:hypothetical protein
MIAAFVLGILSIVLLTFLGLLWLISRLFVFLSGWNRLTAVYGYGAPDGVWTFFRESIKVGAVRYRRVAKAGLKPEGLILAVGGIIRHKPICIPWADMGDIHSARFYQRPCMHLTVGKPPITELLLSNELYRAMYPYLTVVTQGTGS